MSDECEMFGQCMLESLLARPAATAKRNFRKGSAWVGILLIIAAVSPVILGVAIFKEQGAVAIVADVGKTRRYPSVARGLDDDREVAADFFNQVSSRSCHLKGSL